MAAPDVNLMSVSYKTTQFIFLMIDESDSG
jgi:hypothetical protein